jgi:hypothetical protein
VKLPLERKRGSSLWEPVLEEEVKGYFHAVVVKGDHSCAE